MSDAASAPDAPASSSKDGSASAVPDGGVYIGDAGFMAVDPSTIAGWTSANWSCPSATGVDMCLKEWLATPTNSTGDPGTFENAAFIAVANGQIAYEWYNAKLPNGATYAQTFASASKTMVGVLLGVAQQDGYIDITRSVSSYLDPDGTTPWSSTPDEEAPVLLKHLMTQTSGFDTPVTTTSGPLNSAGKACGNDDGEPQCLQYYGPPGAQFRYNTGLYSLLRHVIGVATSGGACTPSSSVSEVEACFQTYFNLKVGDVIGLTGHWESDTTGSPTEWHFVGTGLDAARFGYLLASGGAWNGVSLVDAPYFAEMTSSNPFAVTSDLANLAYGYLTWLGGKASGLNAGSNPWATPPALVWVSGPTFAPAPSDAIMAIGAGGQYIHVSHHGSTGDPRASLVLVRLGSAPSGTDTSQADLIASVWQKFDRILCDSAPTSLASCP